MSDDTSPTMLPEGALPVLPLRDVVVFPHMVIPLFVGREKSIKALDTAMEADKRILLVAQTSPDTDDPAQGDLYPVGAMAQVLQLLRLPDGTIKVLVEGTSRVGVSDIQTHDGALYGVPHELPVPAARDEQETEALSRSLLGLFEQYLKTNRKLPPELMQTLQTLAEPERIADTIAAHLTVRLTDKQRLLETVDTAERLELLIGLVDGELDVQQLEKKIRGRVKSQMEKSQREYYLNEQMKAIQKELGEGEEGGGNELDALAKKIAEAGMPKAVEAKAKAEYAKLKQMSPMSAEAGVVRNYLDWLLGVPWKKRSKVRKDLALAQEVLDADHFGLEKVKDRILEYLAVQSRVSRMKGPILCLVGPPGVGKTSLGQSIAKATNRKFVRMALGGVRDEAEIRGHRRTYVGSMPGRIVQNLNKVGTKNPLFVLDEIDKMAMDFRGDPSAALLEVLDPEQNHAFNDHYLEVDLDLSEVMFIATSNSMNIPGPLLDRMEVIRIPGYTEEEKLNIAMRYLIPKQTKANGLREGELEIKDSAVRDIVRYYTRESGVRNLEREIARIARKVVKEIALAGPQKATGKGAKKSKTIVVDDSNLEKYLSVRRFDYGRAEAENEVGMVTGLAWTEVGGDLLQIETALVPGKGGMTLTGQLGDVMKESATAALSVVRSRAERLGIEHDFLQKFDIHVHVPDGATPKDGPSAGIAMTTALVSSLTKIPIKADVAMTGEITLRGRVTAIGGLKEKLLAALRGGIKTVIIPEENRKDLVDIPKSVTEAMTVVPVKWIDEVLDLALERPILPKTTEAAEATIPAPPAVTRRRKEPAKERGIKH